jgi:hypothetical protein
MATVRQGLLQQRRIPERMAQPCLQ